MTYKLNWLAGVGAGVLVGVAAGIALVWVADMFWLKTAGEASLPEQDEPLYWVAPMDPDYRRDKPGKSPMGMDLVPVYAQTPGSDADPGTVKVAAEVVNNLGVRTARVAYEPLHRTLRTVGYVQYDQDSIIHIHPRVDGWIETLHVKASGDAVAEGQPLYELYSPQLVNAQEELQMALKRNNAALIRAAQERLQALNLLPETIRELTSRAAVKQTITFFAPQSGVVRDLNVREGFYAIPGTPLMSIASLDAVWIEAEVFARQAALVSVGMSATIELEYFPGREWQGKVDYIYPSVDELTRALRLRIRLDNADRTLQPNMFSRVTLHPVEVDEVLTVPREAVVRTGFQDRVVLSLGEGRFKSVAVTLGRMGDARVEILQGLKAGDTVVTSAQFLLDSESSKSAGFKRMQPSPSRPANGSGGDGANAAHMHHHEGASHD